MFLAHNVPQKMARKCLRKEGGGLQAGLLESYALPPSFLPRTIELINVTEKQLSCWRVPRKCWGSKTNGLAHTAKQLKFQFWKLLQFYLNQFLCQATNFENGCMTKPPHLQWIVSILFDLYGVGVGLLTVFPKKHPWWRRENTSVDYYLGLHRWKRTE